jgi:hypothetical protein
MGEVKIKTIDGIIYFIRDMVGCKVNKSIIEITTGDRIYIYPLSSVICFEKDLKDKIGG